MSSTGHILGRVTLYPDGAPLSRTTSQELHDLVTAASSRLGRARKAAPMAGRLSFLSGKYGVSSSSGADTLSTDSIVARANIPNSLDLTEGSAVVSSHFI